MELLSHSEIFIRLILTLGICFILGVERELKNQPAGIRTHILIGVGSCLLMILSIMVPELYGSTVNDPGRIAAQVVSGVGFLGAGAIMKHGFDTKGLTTAANIWVTAAIGLTIGAGLYIVAILASCIILLNLVLITKFKTRFIHPSRYCGITVDVQKKGVNPEELCEKISQLPLRIISKNIKEDTSGQFQIHLITKIKSDTNIFSIKESIKSFAAIKKIQVSENIKL